MASHIGLNPVTQRQMMAGKMTVDPPIIRVAPSGMMETASAVETVLCRRPLGNWVFLYSIQSSFIDSEPLMRKGGTLFTMTYDGSQKVVKNYNIWVLPRPPWRAPCVT